jgi:hypothetical protein
VPLRNVGVLPQPAVVAADAGGTVIVVTAIVPAATAAAAQSTASKARPRCRFRTVLTGVTPSVKVNQTAVMVHWLLVLLFGAHMQAFEPAAV